MDVRVGLWRKLSAEELILLNCGVGEDSLESPLDYREIQPVHSKGNQSWIFIGRTDAEAETPKPWPPDAKNIGKDADAGKDWRQEEKGMTEHEVAGWPHWLNGQEFDKSGRWWRMGKPGVLWSVNTTTEQQFTEQQCQQQLSNNNNSLEASILWHSAFFTVQLS